MAEETFLTTNLLKTDGSIMSFVGFTTQEAKLSAALIFIFVVTLLTPLSSAPLKSPGKTNALLI